MGNLDGGSLRSWQPSIWHGVYFQPTRCEMTIVKTLVSPSLTFTCFNRAGESCWQGGKCGGYVCASRNPQAEESGIYVYMIRSCCEQCELRRHYANMNKRRAGGDREGSRADGLEEMGPYYRRSDFCVTTTSRSQNRARWPGTGDALSENCFLVPNFVQAAHWML